MDGRPVEVTAYASYRGDQEPRSFVLDGRRIDVVSIARAWREPDGRLFVAVGEDGHRYTLLCTEPEATWVLLAST